MTINISRDTLVGDLAVHVPRATALFEGYRIDYCCGGKRTLAQVCERASVSVDHLLEELDLLQRDQALRASHRDWDAEPVAALLDHILDRHHVYTREAIEAIGPLMAKVSRVHGEKHPELRKLASLFVALAADLEPHMVREERVLFPYIRRLEEAAETGRATEAGCFGSVANPIMVMLGDHEAAGDMLFQMRDLTGQYQPPEGACTSYRALYRQLAELDGDLIQHIHLENNVLFPRAQRLESASRRHEAAS